ncbi:DUF1232 domain-containing protein [Phormidium sp. CLA17]|uniref:YkvA family protein n=1 Tax=Leptolyngbya sp. Cla-17 TaxID=2803751 RepID=UPI00149109B4|nr:YkvA family protein [Leptolyngbya sp. Cla-17]MBM0740383.1 DUF1232 domain-containing protein [Leptolyngbya sp. Cla-17]
MKFSIESLYKWYRDVIRNPKYRWWVIGGSLLYLVSPIDISPDVFPVIGWIDDGVIATLLVTELSQVLLTRLKGKKDTDSVDVDVATNTATTDEPIVDVNAVAMK